MAGMQVSGPTPWWTMPGTPANNGAGNLARLNKATPSGYEYDPVTMSYNRTPQSTGERKATEQSSYISGITPAITGLYSAIGGGGNGSAPGGGPGGAGGGPGGAGGGYGTINRVPQVAMPDDSAAQNAIFARAKDKAGEVAGSALTSLRGQLAGRGMLGSGLESRGTRDIIRAGMGQLGDTNREQAIQESERSMDWTKAQYQGLLAQRGQDVSQRGQDISSADAASERANQLALAKQGAIFGLLKGLY